MFRINRNQVESASSTPTAKTDNWGTNSRVSDAVKLVFLNLIDEIRKFSVYSAAHWACHIDRWIDNLHADNTKTYRRGEIIYLDLGAQNFKYEPSYTHACIVLADRNRFILIVPCSTKKYRSGYRDIIDATPADGFTRNTGIQSESFRWVNKNRVVSSTGNTVAPALLDKIDQVLISFAPSNKKELARLNSEIGRLNGEVERLTERVAELEKEISNKISTQESA